MASRIYGAQRAAIIFAAIFLVAPFFTFSSALAGEKTNKAENKAGHTDKKKSDGLKTQKAAKVKLAFLLSADHWGLKDVEMIRGEDVKILTEQVEDRKKLLDEAYAEAMKDPDKAKEDLKAETEKAKEGEPKFAMLRFAGDRGKEKKLPEKIEKPAVKLSNTFTISEDQLEALHEEMERTKTSGEVPAKSKHSAMLNEYLKFLKLAAEK